MDCSAPTPEQRFSHNARTCISSQRVGIDIVLSRRVTIGSQATGVCELQSHPIERPQEPMGLRRPGLQGVPAMNAENSSDRISLSNPQGVRFAFSVRSFGGGGYEDF